jgi:hypothetical protein
MPTKTVEQINADLQWVDAERNDGTWKPERDGDFLQGEYVGFEETNSGKKIYTIVDGTGEKIKIWGGKIIDSYFNHKTGVNIGELVRITYLGRVMIEGKFNDKGEPAYYNDYKVQHTLGKRPQSKLPKSEPKAVESKQAKVEILNDEEEDIDPKNIPF